MDFGSIRRNQSVNTNRRRTFSNSNLSCISYNSSIVGRKTLEVTLPRDFGCEIGPDGRILHMVKGQAAWASGVLQVGDYVRVCNNNQNDNRNSEGSVTLQVTYGTIIADNRPNCPLIVEMGNRSNTSLGIALADGHDNKIRISSLQPGSLADRCGYLKTGDILSSVHINATETVPCSPYYTSYQVAQILRRMANQSSSVTLTICPDPSEPTRMRNTEESETGSTVTLMDNRHEGMTYFRESDSSEKTDSRQQSVNHENNDEYCVLSLCLWKDRLYEDWGFSLVDCESLADNNDNNEDNLNSSLEPLLMQASNSSQTRKLPGSYVYQIRPGGPAFMAGLRPNDRILQINDRDVSLLESTILVPILASLDDALNLVISRLRIHN